MAEAPQFAFSLPTAPGDRLVLLALWHHARHNDPDPIVWPSADMLAEMLGFATRSVRRSLARLSQLGAISRCDRPSSAKRRGLAWRLHPDPTVTLTEQSPDRAVTRQRSKPRPSGHPDQRVILTPVSPVPGPSGHPPPDRAVTPYPDRAVPQNHQENLPLEAPNDDNDVEADLGDLARGARFNAGLVAELDQVRREVEGATGARIGRLSTKGDDLAGLDEAIADLGFDQVKTVVRWHATRAAKGSIDQRLWRFTFRGNAFNAVLEEWTKAEAARVSHEAAQAREAAEEAARGPRLDGDGLAALVEGELPEGHMLRKVLHR